MSEDVPAEIEVVIGASRIGVLMPLRDARPAGWYKPGRRWLCIVDERNRILAEGALGPQGARNITPDVKLMVVEQDANGPARSTALPSVDRTPTAA